MKTDLTTTGKIIFVLFSHAKYEKPLLNKPHCDNKIKIRENTMNTCSCSQVSWGSTIGLAGMQDLANFCGDIRDGSWKQKREAGISITSGSGILCF